MTTGPVIEFNGYRIEEIEYKTIHDIDKSNFSVEPDLSFEFGLSEDMDEGVVKISVSLLDEPNLRTIFLKVLGQFSIPNDIEREKIELYLAQNGSAILFPYVRSIISFLTTLDGPSAVVLPTVNILEELKKK